ncbi:MAG: hypothetical protein N3G74_01825 [Candidatus Micrarchaeota archaeon]|nr:hypothetical protein [Candidatus Micrarchaeota archaeon]
MRETLQGIGPWAFVLGIIAAVLLGLFPKGLGGLNVNLAVLGMLGIIVGLANVTDKELDRYVLANIGFLIAAGMFESLMRALQLGDVSVALISITQNMVFFVAPGLAVVCLREIFEVAKEA